MSSRVPFPGDLIVTFCRGEDELDEIAMTGKHALQIAFRMIVEREELYDGDLIAVRRFRAKRRG
jgi:hypothetical protein